MAPEAGIEPTSQLSQCLFQRRWYVTLHLAQEVVCASGEESLENLLDSRSFVYEFRRGNMRPSKQEI
jgi:hypothetical protein